MLDQLEIDLVRSDSCSKETCLTSHHIALPTLSLLGALQITQSRQSELCQGLPKPPVEPRPPAPRTVTSRLSVSTTSGVRMRSRMSCAMRSPQLTCNWRQLLVIHTLSIRLSMHGQAHAMTADSRHRQLLTCCAQFPKPATNHTPGSQHPRN